MKPKTCIRITGTRSNKLRARVENYVPYTNSEKSIAVLTGERPRRQTTHFEVTIGGENWKTLPRELQRDIGVRARTYIGNLIEDLVENAGIDFYGEEE